ncbi:MAG TPA: divalent-cation tolerance protein CutA [Blastocatellia bacterium]|jgi:periplasmic divalent cation tolerance protein
MGCELVVLVTTATHEEAATIADTLVTERLAACVNIVPAIESIYRWEGKVTRDREALMIIKTTDERYAEVERRIKELHSYSTPEVIAVKIDRGSAGYLDWLRESVLDGSISDHSPNRNS